MADPFELYHKELLQSDRDPKTDLVDLINLFIGWRRLPIGIYQQLRDLMHLSASKLEFLAQKRKWLDRMGYKKSFIGS